MKSAGSRFEVAVFPQTEAVLFPGVTLSLHVFEKRYEKMLQDIRAHGWPLAISLLLPKMKSQKSKGLLLSPICGAGTVQIFREYADGASDILIHGQQRVRLCSVIQEEPYFVMEAESINEQTEATPWTTRSFQDFRVLVKTWAFINPKLPTELPVIFDEFSGFGALTDFFVFHFLAEATEKQAFLDCTNPVERAEMLAQFLEKDLHRLSRILLREKKFHLLH